MKRIIALAIALIFLVGTNGFAENESSLRAADNTTYYVSSSEGNDSNSGLSEEAPWKTLSRAAQIEYNPGDTILLKCGDKWEESFIPKGNATSKNWITLSSYGEGNRPVISPGLDKLWGIYLHNIAGWKIKGIEVCYAQAGIRLLNDGYKGTLDGFMIDDCYVHHIYGAPQNPWHKEEGLYMSYGISTFKVLGRGAVEMKNVTIKNTVVEDTDAPITIYSSRNVVIENVICERNYKEGILLGTINTMPHDSGYMKNVKVIETGFPKGMYWGIAGVQFNSTNNFLMEDCEVGYVYCSGNPDGVGVDFEGTCSNVTMNRVHIHHTESNPILIFRNPSWGKNNFNINVLNCTFEYNGLKNREGNAALFSYNLNENMGGIVKGNKIKKFSDQPLNIWDIPYKHGSEIFVPYMTWSNNEIEVVEPGEYENYTMRRPYTEHQTNYRWTFKNGLNGWSNGSNLEISHENDCLNAQILGSDPHVFSPDNIGIDLSENDVVAVKMKNSTDATSARIYFTTDIYPTIAEDKTCNGALVRNDTEYKTYTFDMSEKTGWKGKLKQIRLDFDGGSANSAGNISIESISIGRRLKDGEIANEDNIIYLSKETPDSSVTGEEKESALLLPESDVSMIPVWDSDIIYNESCLMIKDKNQATARASLMFKPEEIISVRDSSLNKEYKKGVDWNIRGNEIYLTENSSIPFMTYAELNPKNTISGKTQKKKSSGNVFFSEGSYFHTRQIFVTYKTKEKWTGEKPEYQINTLPKTINKLKNKENVKVCLYGDSIAAGANASGRVGVAPNQPIWGEAFVNNLKKTYGSQIDFVNSSLGGKTSAWGIENVYNNCIRHNPDLVVLAFGMNDGTQNVDKEKFCKNIGDMIASIRNFNADCEFIVVAPMLANDETVFAGTQETYISELKKLEGNGIAVCNMTGVHKYLLTKKSYQDMTGNNVNHPNDFLIRLYAQYLSDMLIEK